MGLERGRGDQGYACCLSFLLSSSLGALQCPLSPRLATQASFSSISLNPRTPLLFLIQDNKHIYESFRIKLLESVSLFLSWPVERGYSRNAVGSVPYQPINWGKVLL